MAIIAEAEASRRIPNAGARSDGLLSREHLNSPGRRGKSDGRLMVRNP